MSTRLRAWAIGCCLAALSMPAARAQEWPAVFDPMQVVTLNLDMPAADWETIQNDQTFTVELPATFWADGEAPLLVSVRRKSADALQNGTPFAKVSLKIDINEFVPGQLWRGLNKLSLENGDDQDVVSEGFAWHMHRLASGPLGYDYLFPAAMSAWVRLNINGTDTGVYLSVEQRDTRFLRNRGLYIPGETWMYEVEDPGQLELHTGTPDSPAVQALCFQPFEIVGASCPTPDLATFLPQHINMRSMLTMAAVNAFLGANDSMFPAGKNFFFADFLTGRTRMYLPWDLDSVMGGNAGSFYATNGNYGATMLAIPQFRAQYSQIMNELMCGPLQLQDLLGFLDSVEAVLTPALAADPNAQIDGSVAAFFDGRRNWVSNRFASIQSQIEGFVPCGTPPCTADFDGNGTVAVPDIFAFLAAWFAGNPSADIDGVPGIAVPDIFTFLSLWFAGCP